MEECIFCKTGIDWDSADSQRGNIWSCDRCGDDFCSRCFIERTEEKYPPGHERYIQVLCPNCFTKDNVNVEVI